MMAAMLELIVTACILSTSAASNLRHIPALNVSIAPLPKSDADLLRKVEQGVKALKVPAQTQPSSPSSPVQGQVKMSGCSLFGGVVKAQLSKQCCTNMQVVTQRQLLEYGMAEKCKSTWQCGADGMTPVPTFETQALSSMCGETGCLPRVVSAIKSNSMTRSSASSFNGICANLASIGGGGADPQQVSQLLTAAGRQGGRMGKGRSESSNSDDKRKKRCREDKCKDSKQKAEFCTDENSGDKCYKACCNEKKDSSCFPGEAVALVRGKGEMPLARVNAGDWVLVAQKGQLVFEPVLSFLHIVRQRSGESMPFVTIIHAHGMFRASAAHITFVTEESGGRGWKSTLVGDLRVGDEVFTSAGEGAMWDAKPSRILEIQRSSTSSGMYAPLTSSGTVVIDGVVASNYASPSEHKRLPHWLAHAFLFPARLYHCFGFRLESMWQRLCSFPALPMKNWICQGGSATQGDAAGEGEEIHPYLRIMWKGLKMDRFLV